MKKKATAAMNNIYCRRRAIRSYSRYFLKGLFCSYPHFFKVVFFFRGLCFFFFFFRNDRVLTVWRLAVWHGGNF